MFALQACDSRKLSYVSGGSIAGKLTLAPMFVGLLISLLVLVGSAEASSFL